MTFKEFLTQASKLNKAIDSAILQIAEWREFSVKSRSYLSAGKNPSRGRSSSIEQIVTKIMLAEEQLNKDIDRYVDVKNEIRSFIALLSDPEERAVLERHYLLGQTWDVVATESFVCLRTIHSLHSRALKKLEPIYYRRVNEKTAV